MDNRLKAAQDAAWTEIAKKEEQLKALLENGFQDESDIVLLQETITLVLAEIMWRKAELQKIQADNKCELVVDGKYQIAFTDDKQPSYTWFDGPATFIGLDPDDYETGGQHGIFRIEKGKKEEEVTSFPLSSVGKRLR